VTAIAAVLFDMYGTLTPNFPQAFWDEQKRESAAPLGIPAHEWVASLDESWHERVSGQFGDLTETFRTVAARLGRTPTDEQLAAAVAARYASYRAGQQLRPDALETLRALRAEGLKTALVSDCTAELPALWESLELAPHFDAAVFSSREGTRKPDPKLFRAAAQRLGVTPEVCLYVGDGGGNELAGSAAVGMLPVLLAAEDWAGSRAPGRPETQWTGLRAAALAEIPGILARVRAGNAEAADRAGAGGAAETAA
jgi:putative hydrolase of the HAD superfamily